MWFWMMVACFLLLCICSELGEIRKAIKERK